MLRARSVLADENGAVTISDLAPLQRWVAWRTEVRNGKATKVPYSPVRDSRAKVDDPSTWGTRAQAEAKAAALKADGVGLGLGDLGDGTSLAGVDLDTCCPEGGAYEPWSLEVLERFGTYAEVSPSGTGAKLFFLVAAGDLATVAPLLGKGGGKAFKQPGEGDHPPAIELYTAGRYFTVTGEKLDTAPAELRTVPAAELLWLLQDAGPAMAADAPAEPRKAARSATPAAAVARGGDGSRSAQAFKVAAHVKRHGGDFPAFLEALDGNPDTAAWKAEKGSANGGRELRRCWEGAERAVDQDVLLTEHGVALAFTKRHRDALRYCHDTGAWFEWTGTRWREDRKHAAFSFARDLVAEANREAEFKTQAITGKAAFAGGVEKFAQRDPAHAVTTEDWDADPFLLATPGGTVELRTGRMRAARPGDMMTRITAVAPSTAAPPDLWLRFLDEATGKDDELIRFLQRWCGYCLTGDTREHALLFVHGFGGNGKGVFLNTTSRILGTYAAVASMDTFTASQGDKHPTDLAMLRGARLVTAQETEEGRAWAEARVKAITGGDPITARFMRQDFFTYRPQFKLTIAGNHKPVLRNLDPAMKRRMNMLPFTRVPAAPDRELEAKLEAEWPGILAWMIEGCRMWLADGLERPAAVAEATADYFDAQDTMGQWVAERCILHPTLELAPSLLLRDFNEWADRNGAARCDNTKFRGWAERQPGLRYVWVKGSRFIKGVGLQPPAGVSRVSRGAEDYP